MMLEEDISLYKHKILELKDYSKSLRALLVEDYIVLQKSLHRIFSLLFEKVDVADDGIEGLKLYKNSKYDIVFSDIVMPSMNGVELTKEIKAINPKQSIIIFSAHQDSKYLKDFINLGVKRFISKPVSLNDLLDEMILVCKEIHEQKQIQNKILLCQNIYYLQKEQELYVDDKLLKLSYFENLILELFISKQNQIVSNEEIVTYLYAKNVDIEFENVRKMVYKLRKKLSNELIQNVHGMGYKLATSINH